MAEDIKKPLNPAAIGIDCKEKEINISLIDTAGKEIKKECLKMGNKNNLPETLSNILKKLNPDNSISILAAVSAKDEEKYSNGLPQNLNFISRHEALHSASLGGKEGMLLEADFKSKTFIIDGEGNFKNFTTEGDDYGKGSSCWIVKYYNTFNAEAEKKEKTASINKPICAREIIKRAMNNDLRAAQIIDFAQADLCNLVLKTLINTSGITKEINIALAGELIENEFFRSSLIRKIKASIKTCSIHAKTNICLPRRSIALECALLAKGLLK